MENKLTIEKEKPFIKKYFWLFIFIAFIAVVLLYEFIPKAYAAFSNIEQVRKEFEEFVSGYSQTMFDRMGQAYSQFTEFMKPDSKYAFGNTVGTLIQSFAQILVVMYMIVNLIQEAQKGDPGFDYWTKIFVRTAAAVMMVVMISDVMSSLYGLGNLLVERTSEGMESVVTTHEISEDQQKELIKELSKIPGLSDIGAVLGDEAPAEEDGDEDSSQDAVNWYQLQKVGDSLKMLNYIAWFPMIIGIFLMFSAIFEVRIRQLFAPVAVATIAHEGARGGGVRFLKKYFACYIKIMIYFALAALGSMLTHYFLSNLTSGTSTGTGFNINLVLMLMSNVVAGLAMMQSGGLGDEIVGS